MIGSAVRVEDIDFLLERFKALTVRRNFKLPSEWIESVRYIDKSLTPFPGKFSYSKFPYFVEIVNQFSPDCPTQEVFFMKGNQIGATTGLLESVMMYYIGECPSPQLYVLPDEQMAKDAMEKKIDPAIDGCGLRERIMDTTKRSKGARNTGDTKLSKTYINGYLMAVGANSGNRFRNFSYKIVLIDEADGMKSSIKGEGDVYSLAKGRVDAYKNHSKIYIGSTPTEKRSSVIEPLFNDGSKKYYYVPCKHCGKMQKLEWCVWDESKTHQIGGIVWKNNENYEPILDTVGYKCPYCGEIMKNYDKAVIMAQGEWRASNPNPRRFVESYHLTALYNPPGMYSWEDYVVEWSGCWDLKTNKLKDKQKYKVFRNQKQGLTFEDSGESIKREKALRFRRFGFARGTIPNKMAVEDCGSEILLLVCSVDVQKNGLYVDIVGYADRGCSWSIDFRFIEGATEDFHGPWDKLADIIDNEVFLDEEGKRYRVGITLVDSGHYTDWVYSFCARYSGFAGGGVFACKGSDWLKGGETYQLFNPATLQRIGLPLAYHINTGKIKDRISTVMNSSFWEEGMTQPGWYFNFPEDFRDDYYDMYEAEEKVEVVDKITGKWIKTIWRAIFGRPNHGFDTRVYNWAALEIVAESICRDQLRIRSLNWGAFWEYAKSGALRGD